MRKRKNRRRETREKTAAGREVRRQSRLDAQFLDDLQYWIGVNPRTAARILEVVQETLREPFTGIGKPEALRGEKGVWSRRLTDEHRITYRVTDEHVDFLQARFHYSR